MIEIILSDRTEERRRLFEEAAGVTKYKHRRKAAFRKLESVQADLLRVQDLIAEVQKAVNTLERQARRAEQFNEVKTRLRTLEVDLIEREYAQIIGRLEPLQEKQQSLRAERNITDVDLENVESTLEDLRSSLLSSEKELAEAQRDVSQHREKVHRVEEKNLVAEERTKALRGLLTRLEREDVDLLAEQERQEALRVELKQTLEIADHVIILANGQVAIEGTPDEVRNSSDAMVYQYLNAKPDGPVRFHFPGLAVEEDFALVAVRAFRPVRDRPGNLRMCGPGVKPE